ncbi:hypothetical protein RvY_11248 [Ramazzottius varieornatus]|uniref:Uncharacterized protein n=1 Tax=Ramazzottius varieornatus TaxID=947166 RepID=A0A1D1VN90_RAMVA|nr:hypothetical protein RvY_11248 [Ramazzottius varieornatus]
MVLHLHAGWDLRLIDFEESEEAPLGFDKFLMEDLSAVLMDKQLRIKCIQELCRKSRQNMSDSFFISSAGKFDSQYGRWRIRTTLPSNVQSLTRIGRINLNASHQVASGTSYNQRFI